MRIAFDDLQITVSFPDGEVRSIRWDEIAKVGITTTDEGPIEDDVFWGFHKEDGAAAVIFPAGTPGEGELLSALQARLHGFRNDVLIQAMGSTEDAHFVIWERARA